MKYSSCTVDRIYILLLLWTLSFNVNKLSAEEPFWFFSCSAPSGHIIAIGYAPAYTDISKSFREARISAAECLAKQLYVLVRGLDVYTIDNYSSISDILFDIEYRDEDFLNAKMNSVVLDSVSIGGSVYNLSILAYDGSQSTTSLNEIRILSKIDNLERFLESSPYQHKSLPVGYGIGKSLRRKGQSFTDSHERAIVDFVKSCSVQIYTQSTDYLEKNVAYANTLTKAVYNGIVENLTISQYWFSNSTSSFHCVVEKKGIRKN